MNKSYLFDERYSLIIQCSIAQLPRRKKIDRKNLRNCSMDYYEYTRRIVKKRDRLVNVKASTYLSKKITRENNKNRLINVRTEECCCITKKIDSYQIDSISKICLIAQHTCTSNYIRWAGIKWNSESLKINFAIVPIQCVAMIKIVFFSAKKRQNCAKKEIALTFISMYYSIALLRLGCCLRNTEHNNRFQNEPMQCIQKQHQLFTLHRTWYEFNIIWLFILLLILSFFSSSSSSRWCFIVVCAHELYSYCVNFWF